MTLRGCASGGGSNCTTARSRVASEEGADKNGDDGADQRVDEVNNLVGHPRDASLRQESHSSRLTAGTSGAKGNDEAQTWRQSLRCHTRGCARVSDAATRLDAGSDEALDVVRDKGGNDARHEGARVVEADGDGKGCDATSKKRLHAREHGRAPLRQAEARTELSRAIIATGTGAGIGNLRSTAT
eukprot:5743865-Pleurochrysis_carterae.AAC.1